MQQKQEQKGYSWRPSYVAQHSVKIDIDLFLNKP